MAGDYPQWLETSFAGIFGEESRRRGRGARQPRAARPSRHILKAHRNELRSSLAHLGAEATPWSPWGLRIALAADARSPGIHSETDFLKGRVEVQDEGSQLAALFSGARAGQTVIDLCAGAGGKTLALAAMMNNEGRLITTDRDKRRLAHPRAHCTLGHQQCRRARAARRGRAAR